METILTNLEKRTASIKITVMKTENKENVIKNSIWFGGRHHRVDGFTEISPDTLCIVFYH